MRAVFSSIARVWFTGLLFILALLGYLLYGLLWIYRRALWQTATAFIIAVACMSAAYLHHLNSPGPPGTEPIELIVSPGASLRNLADTLQQLHVISSARQLRLWLKLSRMDRRIQAGKFTFRRNDGIFRAAAALMRAQPIERSVTIPEGLTIEQIAGIYTHAIDIDSAEFLAACHNEDIIARVAPGATSLEGYLFPDTYRFPERATALQAVERMVDRFEKAYATISADSGIAARFSRHQIVTLASIVEKEATLRSEQTRIAGVFHNRLRLGYPLGADPTVRYILRKFSGPLRVSELNVDSPYNTRRFQGLPPGPICSPGLGSLQAAANPMQTDELYFVALWDGSGAHTFSRSNAEHDRKKMEIRAQNELRLRKLRKAP